MPSNLDLIRGRQVVVTLTNKSGGQVVAGDVVIVDTANDESFTTTTTANLNTREVGIAQETIANDASGRVLIRGYAPLVNVNASATRGYYLFTHTVAKQAASSATRAAGAFGQVIKAGTTPSAFLWGVPDPTSGGGGGSVATDTIWDAKGDLAVASGADAASRLAVGSNGQVLTADSGETLGVKWATPVSDKSLFYYRQIGTTVESYYLAGGPMVSENLTNATPSLNTMYALPYWEERGGTIDRIAAHVNSALASSVFRLGIYTPASATDLTPSALVLDSGELSGASTGFKTATISQVLTAGQLYWFVILMGTAAAQMRAITSTRLWPVLGFSADFTAVPRIGFTASQTYGALPSTFPAASVMTNSISPTAIGVRYSA